MRILTRCPRLSRAMVASLTALLFLATARADDTLPKGFDVGRYAQLWERNPFTLVTPSLGQGAVSAFSKLILVNWLHDKGKDILFVQNTETNEVKKVTKDEGTGPDSLRLIEVVPNKNPSLVFAKLTDGKEEGVVKFRFEQAQNTQVVNPNIPGQRVLPGQGPLPNGQFNNVPGGPMRRIPQMPGQVNQQNNANAAAPDAQEIRRRRMLPTPVQNQVPVPQNNAQQNNAEQNNNNGGADSDDDE
jgi:hypothetical protein